VHSHAYALCCKLAVHLHATKFDYCSGQRQAGCAQQYNNSRRDPHMQIAAAAQSWQASVSGMLLGDSCWCSAYTHPATTGHSKHSNMSIPVCFG
jgi:hypothetical protein